MALRHRLPATHDSLSRFYAKGNTADVGVACYASSPSLVELYVKGSDGKLRVASLTAKTVLDA